MKRNFRTLFFLCFTFLYLSSNCQEITGLFDEAQLKKKMDLKSKDLRMDDLLMQMSEEYKAQIQEGIDPAKIKMSFPYIAYHDGYISMDFSSKNPNLLLAELKRLGLKQPSVYKHVISGLFPMKNIDLLQECKYLTHARGAYYKPLIGSVSSQGDEAMRTRLARRALRVTGEGTKVGVISDSYDANDGAEAGILSGDLPGTANPFGITNEVEVLLDDFDPDNIDEGRAMLEIVHDVAPGAELAFHTALGGQAVFANGILDLAEAGSDVIVDDIIYFAEPMFQDGIIAQAADIVNSQGVAYFSSAGNQGPLSFDFSYQGSGIGRTFIFPDGEVFETEFHEFENGQIFLPLEVPPGEFLLAIPQWDQPYFSATGGEGASTDVDFIVLNASLDSVIFQSVFANIGGDPIEILAFENTTDEAVVNLVIEKFAGPDPNLIKLVPFDVPQNIINDVANAVGTTYGHANAEGAFAVGASPYFLTPPFNEGPAVIEPFSAAGGIPIVFDLNDVNIGPTVRPKPNIVGPDGGNTTFFTNFDLEGDGFPNFFGTSASAPHVAALGALMLEANPSLTPTEMISIMQETASDMDNPLTPGFDAGFDLVTGPGYVQGFEAAAAAADVPVITSFSLVNSETDELIPGFETLFDGVEINLNEIGTDQISIVANTFPENIGRVVFLLKGAFTVNQTENIFPYALFGDRNGDFRPPRTSFRPGQTFTLAAFPTSNTRTRIRGVAKNISFSIGGNLNTFQPLITQVDETDPSLSVYPNPSSGQFTLAVNATELAELEIFNNMGQSIHKEIFDPKSPIPINLSGYSTGVYIIRVQSKELSKSTRLLLD